jgi:glycine/D-amino acid oxidase-like deaminating enzyme
METTMPRPIRRRDILVGAGAALAASALPGCAPLRRDARTSPGTASRLELAPLRAGTDRVTRITVCTRPFRAQGPRIEIERVGEKNVVHNYGHGGSGWSLSWGSGALALQLALATGERDLGVIGCGALGLTSAILAQRAGARVTIHAKELPPNVRSSLATGVWTPDSRICFDEYATPAFKQSWAAMARASYERYQSYMGLPGNPVEFIDSYFVSDTTAMGRRRQPPSGGRPAFAELQRELIPDLIPNAVEFPPGRHPLGNHHLRQNTLMMFNLSAYSHLLFSDFLANGGKINIAEFHVPADLAALPQRTLINATGYGARALFDDRSITPVRGQLARLIPQPEINYGLFYRDVAFVPRRDGLVFQVVGDDDYYGFDDATIEPDRVEAQHAVDTIARLFQDA